eukprot:4715369-Amphidinium_carterae.1
MGSQNFKSKEAAMQWAILAADPLQSLIGRKAASSHPPEQKASWQAWRENPRAQSGRGNGFQV